MQEYNKTDQQIHLICQLIAKVNRSLVPQKEDDCHTNLYFDALGNRIYGRWFSINSVKFILFFDLMQQAISLENQDYQITESVDIKDKTIATIENEISQLLKSHGAESSTLMAPLHFEIPKYSFANDVIKGFSDEEIKKWTHYRALANQACYDLLGHLQLESEVRIWPHHFDTGIYTEINDKIGIGFGLAMQDDMVDEPYLYFSVYGLNGHEVNYNNIQSLKTGYWIVDNWKGSVLKMSKINPKAIHSFLLETVNWTVMSDIKWN